jgi:hypothetical protein
MITIWVVEDNPSDADKAAESIVKLAKQKFGDRYARSLRLYWDRTMQWAPTLHLMDATKTSAPVNAANDPPDIVVLDLFDQQGFVGEVFLRALRQWELSRSKRSPAWVILWSVKTGLEEVDAFNSEEPRRDRRVVAMETKGLVALSDKLARCWQSWEEEQVP